MRMASDPIGPETGPDTGFAPEPRVDLLGQSLSGLSARDRAEIEAEHMLAQGRQREEAKKRLKDLSVVDLITRDMEESRQRNAAIMRRVEEVQRRLQAPAPAIPTGTDYNQEELLGMLVGSVLAPGSAGQIIQAGRGIAQQRQALEFQNRAQEWQQQQELAQQEQSVLQAQGRDETSYQRDLRRMQVGAIADERQREDEKIKARVVRGQNLQSAYNASNLPGEKQAIADQWRREFEQGGVNAPPPPAEAVAADIKALKSPEIAREMTRYKSLLEYHTKTYGSDPSVVAELEATRAYMIQQYFDGNEAAIPKIPTAKTLMEQRAAEQKRQFDAKMELANSRFSFLKDVQFPQQMAARWASIQVMRDSLQETAFRNNVYAGQAAARGGFGPGIDVSGFNTALGQFDDATSSFIRDFAGDATKGAIKRMMDIDRELANKKGQLANKGALTGKKEDELAAEIAGLEAEKAHIVKMLGDMQQDRQNFGLNPVDPFQAAEQMAAAGAAARQAQPSGPRSAPARKAPPKRDMTPPPPVGLPPGVTRVG